MLTERYKLQEQVSADPEGAVYRALDRLTREPVEVRYLRPEEEQLWPQVVRRCKLAAMIDGPGIRRVRVFEPEGSPPVLVLDAPGNYRLKELVEARRPVPLRTAVRVIERVAEALISAHQVGLAHGQLTPGTISWSGPLDDPLAGCAIDCTRCPPQPRIEQADDIRQLAELWSWILGAPPTALADVTDDLQQLFLNMQSSQIEEVPSAATVYSALSAWLQPISPELAGRSTAAGARLNADGSVPHPESTMVNAKADTDADGSLRKTSVVEVDRLTSDDVWRIEPTPVPEQLPEPPGNAPAAAAVKRHHKRGTDPLATRQTLGRFKLLSKLGEGGMGAVWRAEDPLDGTIVAVKVLRADLAQKDVLLKRFHREARLLAEVNNPYVANMLEINSEDNLHYIVLEYVDGSDLQAYLAEHGRLPERMAAAITADVARALRDAHEKGIVHRDLKPDNILLCNEPATSETPAEFPRVKLTDFGLARHVNQTDSMHLTTAGSVVGTPLYISPEQCSGRDNVDVRADVYSLGATLFHALTGRPPFEATSAIGLITKHVNEPAPRVRTIVPDLTEAIDEIVAKCLQKKPESRYQNAADLLRDLERLIRGEPTSIAAHPQLPHGDVKDALAFDFTWELKNPPHLLWPHVSNTERLNRAIGLPAVTYSTTSTPGGDRQQMAQFRKLGMSVAWQEHPFEWIEGRRMGVLREFTQGPWKWFTSVVEMTPRQDGGTTLIHRIRILPSNFIGRTAAHIEVGMKSRKALDGVYRRIDAVLSGEMGALADPFEEENDLPTESRLRLDQRLARMVERGVPPFLAERLGEYLAEAPAQEVSRIRPLALARRLSVDEKQLLAACLIGAHEGLLTLMWDIICPLCRIPSQVKDTLKAIKDHGRCEACHTNFELDFANSIELIFRIAPDIHPTEVGTYCIGGPGHSPHVAAQVRLAPGERFELDLALMEGAYRLRGPQLPYVLDFRVTSGATATRWELTVANGPRIELPRQLKPGEQLFVLTNDAEHEIVIRIERMANRTDACTAARAAATPLFRELFPGECLAPEQLVQVQQITLLSTRLTGADQLYYDLGDSQAFTRLHEHFRALEAVVRKEGGSLIKTMGEGICAVFTEPVQAIRAALAMQSLPEPRLQVAVHSGPAMVATINEQLDYFGTTVSTTLRLLDAPAPENGERPRVLLTDTVARDLRVASIVAEAPSRPRLIPLALSLGMSRKEIFAHVLEVPVEG